MFEEYGLTEYLKVWNGVTVPKYPSIIIDSIPRSGNIFLATIINKSFPNVFQRWGYKEQHHPETFSFAKDHFDLVIVPMRNPIDSLTSWVTMTKSIDREDMVLVYIDNFLQILKEINKNKNDLMIVKFEDFIIEPDLVLDKIAGKIKQNITVIDIDSIREEIRELTDTADGFYSVPRENKEELAINKEIILSNTKYSEYLKEMNALYLSIIA